METEERENTGQEPISEKAAQNGTPEAADGAAHTSPAEHMDTEPAQERERDAHVGQATDADSVHRLEQERDQYRDALIRERADFENYKKSHAAVAASAFDNGVGTAIVAMLPVLDNFERALAAECTDSGFADGMNMIMRQMRTALEGLGVEEVDTSGGFDPTIHHAVAQSEEPDLETNHISETLQKGYTLKGKLMRPAMVRVNK